MLRRDLWIIDIRSKRCARDKGYFWPQIINCHSPALRAQELEVIVFTYCLQHVNRCTWRYLHMLSIVKHLKLSRSCYLQNLRLAITRWVIWNHLLCPYNLINQIHNSITKQCPFVAQSFMMGKDMFIEHKNTISVRHIARSNKCAY